MCEEKNENEDEAGDEGPRTNRRGEVLMSSVERGGKQPKQAKGAEVVWHCLIPLLQTAPPPLQFPRLFRNINGLVIWLGSISSNFGSKVWTF